MKPINTEIINHKSDTVFVLISQSGLIDNRNMIPIIENTYVEIYKYLIVL